MRAALELRGAPGQEASKGTGAQSFFSNVERGASDGRVGFCLRPKSQIQMSDSIIVDLKRLPLLFTG